MANEAGGKDNITVQLVEFAVSIKPDKKQNKGLSKKIFLVTGLAVIFVLVVLITAYSIFFRKDNAIEVESNGTVRTESPVQNDTDRNGKDSSTDPEIPKDEVPAPPAQTPEPPKQAPTPPVPTPSAEAPINDEPTVETPQNGVSPDEVNQTGSGSETGQ
jgi:hypothetical protein